MCSVIQAEFELFLSGILFLPLVSGTVMQLEFCEKLRSGFCYFFDSLAKKFLWDFPNALCLLERLRTLLLVLLTAPSSGAVTTLWDCNAELEARLS